MGKKLQLWCVFFPDDKTLLVHLSTIDLSKMRAVFLVYARACEIKAVIHRKSVIRQVTWYLRST